MSDANVLEIAICTVTNKPAAEAARQAAMESVRHYPGFISWRALTSHGDGNMVADLVEWENIEAARAAAQKVHADPAFQPYMKEIVTVAVIEHFDTKAVI